MSAQFRGADVGDVLVHEVPAQLEGDVGHQPGADDGAVGLVEVPLDRPHRGGRAAVEVLGAGELRGALRGRAAGRPAGSPDAGTALNHSATSVTSPPTETHCASQSAGTESCGMPGPIFTPTAQAGAGQRLDEGQRRGEVLRIPDPLGARGGGGPAGRIQPDAVDPVEGHRRRIGMDHGGVPERDEVHRGAGGRGLVHFHRRDRDVQRGERHGIGAEAAAEVRHVADAGLREALRVPGRHGEPGGLLQARLGEDHLPGELAELGLGLGPQPRLGEDGGDQFGGVAGLPEGRIEPERLVLPVGAQRRQQLPAFGVQKRGDLVLRCVSHGIKPSSARGGSCAPDRVDGMEDSGTANSGTDETTRRTAPRSRTRRRTSRPQGLARYARPALIAGAVIAVVCVALLVIIFFLDSFNATVYSVGGKDVTGRHRRGEGHPRQLRRRPASAASSSWSRGSLLAAAGGLRAVPAPERVRPGDEDNGEDVDFEDLGGR